MLSRKPYGDDDADESRNPVVSLKPVQDLVPEERDNQSNDCHYDNPNIDADIFGIYSGQCLPADDTVNDCEPGDRRKVQNHNNVDQV